MRWIKGHLKLEIKSDRPPLSVKSRETLVTLDKGGYEDQQKDRWRSKERKRVFSRETTCEFPLIPQKGDTSREQMS